MGHNDVAGYGHNPGYDGPYHPSAELDPAVKFAHAGDTKKQAELEVKAYEKAKELHDERAKQRDESLESWELEQGKNVVVREDNDNYPGLAAKPLYEPPRDLQESDVLDENDAVTSEPVKEYTPQEADAKKTRQIDDTKTEDLNDGSTVNDSGNSSDSGSSSDSASGSRVVNVKSD